MERKTALRIVLGVALVTLAIAPPTALAGKGGGGGKPGRNTGNGTISLVMVYDANGNGSPNWGDSVRFSVATTATTQPNVDLTCTQNGIVVYGATTGYYDSYPWPWTQTMGLTSSKWTGGAASCIAKLYAFAGSGTTTLATLSFTAGA
jgi:hypothetical protein